MTDDLAVPEKSALEDQARRLLEEARRHSNATVEDIVKSLGEFQPRGAGTRRSWYDWQERPETVSILTGLAAMHLLGPVTAGRLIFGEEASAPRSAAGPDGTIEGLKQALSGALVELAALRDQVKNLVVPELEKQGELLARLLAQAEVGSSGGSERQPRRRSAAGK